MSLQEKWSSKK